MKKLLFLLLLLSNLILIAQNKVEKPKLVIIHNEQIVSMETLQDYAKQGRLKAMNKGVSQAKRDALYAIHGDKIGDKEFITVIELRTEEEMAEMKRIAPSKTKKPKKEGKELYLDKGDKAFDFNVKMIDDSEVQLSDLKGKVVLLNFWATWCGPCLREFAEIPETILKPFGDKDFVFIPIAIGQKKETVLKKMKDLKKYGVEFNSGYDTYSKIWNEYATGGIPKNFLIDKNGVIQYTSKGYSEESLATIAKKIKQLLSEN